MSMSRISNPPSRARPASETDLQEFRHLLVEADGAWLSLDGDREDQDRAYEAVGEFVTRHSDVLIAIWDGKAWERRGGTAQIVEYAALHGVPVWWIHATEPRVPVWLTDSEDLRDPLPSPSEPPFATLETYLNKQIRPPKPVERDRHGFIGSIARRGQEPTDSPIADYFAEKGTPPGAWSKLYGLMMRWASGRQSAMVRSRAAARFRRRLLVRSLSAGRCARGRICGALSLDLCLAFPARDLGSGLRHDRRRDAWA